MGTSSPTPTGTKGDSIINTTATNMNTIGNNNVYETQTQMNKMTYDGYGHDDIKILIQNKTSNINNGATLGYPLERYPRTSTNMRASSVQRIYPSYVTDLPIYQHPTIISTTPSYCIFDIYVN